MDIPIHHNEIQIVGFVRIEDKAIQEKMKRMALTIAPIYIKSNDGKELIRYDTDIFMEKK